MDEMEEGLDDACQGDGVIGDVDGRDVIIVDDLIDGADSFGRSQV
jgi:phosphoribosylpyrophosphate synthetase